LPKTDFIEAVGEVIGEVEFGDVEFGDVGFGDVGFGDVGFGDVGFGGEDVVDSGSAADVEQCGSTC
jgi:hypothetical protein